MVSVSNDNSQSSACFLLPFGFDRAGDILDVDASASRPAQACDAESAFAGCFPCSRSDRCFSTSAALSAMVMFAPFDLLEDPENKSLNASPPELTVFLMAGVVLPFGGPATYEGVVDRVLVDELVAASKEKTSFCGFRD